MINWRHDSIFRLQAGRMVERQRLTEIAAVAGVISALIAVLAYCGLQPDNSDSGTANAPAANQNEGAENRDGTAPDTATAQPTPPGLTYLSRAISSTNNPGVFPAVPLTGDAVSWIQSIAINGIVYPESIMVANFSSPVVFLLGRQFKRLRTVVGLTDDSDSDGRLRFEIVLDGQRKFQISLGKGADRKVDLDVSGVYEIKLLCANVGDATTTFCGFGDAEVS